MFVFSRSSSTRHSQSSLSVLYWYSADGVTSPESDR